MRLLVPILLLCMTTNFLFSQEVEETQEIQEGEEDLMRTTVETNINIQLDASLPDSIRDHINVIIFDIIKIEQYLEELIHLATYPVPDHVTDKDAGEKMLGVIGDVVQEYTADKLNDLISPLVDYYLANFTMEEIKEIKKLYQTPLGEKLRMVHLKSMPILLNAHKEYLKIVERKIKETFPEKNKE